MSRYDNGTDPVYIRELLCRRTSEALRAYEKLHNNNSLGSCAAHLDYITDRGMYDIALVCGRKSLDAAIKANEAARDSGSSNIVTDEIYTAELMSRVVVKGMEEGRIKGVDSKEM